MKKLLVLSLLILLSNKISAQLDKEFFTSYTNSDKSIKYRIEHFEVDNFSTENLPKISENEQIAFVYTYQLGSSDYFQGFGVVDLNTNSFRLIDLQNKARIVAIFKANKGRLSLSIKENEEKTIFLLNEIKSEQ